MATDGGGTKWEGATRRGADAFAGRRPRARGAGPAVTLALPERADSQGEQHVFAVALGGAER